MCGVGLYVDACCVSHCSFWLVVYLLILVPHIDIVPMHLVLVTWSQYGPDCAQP